MVFGNSLVGKRFDLLTPASHTSKVPELSRLDGSAFGSVF
jgi:hypothetical protein